jgi:hypothetical protein
MLYAYHEASHVAASLAYQPLQALGTEQRVWRILAKRFDPVRVEAAMVQLRT